MFLIVLIVALVVPTVVFAVDDGAVPPGKRSRPGKLSPTTAAGMPQAEGRGIFIVGRDPFKQPTEILPTDCPPSMPLCKFDYSQLKVVGVLQMGDGPYKAFVEDPDGRGYMVVAGQMIGKATVTQVTKAGILLRLHRKAQDVTIPMYLGKES